MSPIAPQIISVSIIYSIVCSGESKENIKAPRHWPLWGEFTSDLRIPAQRASNAETFDDVIVSLIIWRGGGGGGKMSYDILTAGSSLVFWQYKNQYDVNMITDPIK